MTRTSEIFEALLVESLGGPRKFGDTFAKIARIFNTLKVPYALIGAVSLGLTTSIERYTKDIDILSFDDYKDKIHKALTAEGFTTTDNALAKDQYMVRYTDQDTGIEVDMMYSDEMVDPESSVVHMAVKAKAFDSEVKVSTPTMSAWMYLHSNEIKHESDIVQLLKVGAVDISKLRTYLHQSDQEFLSDKLNTLIAGAKSETTSKWRSK